MGRTLGGLPDTAVAAGGDFVGIRALGELKRVLDACARRRPQHREGGSGRLSAAPPLAHFGVWRSEGMPAVDGVRLPLGDGSSLADRHWFPLAREA